MRPEKKTRPFGAWLASAILLFTGVQFLGVGINLGMYFGNIGVPFAVIGIILLGLAVRIFVGKLGSGVVEKTAQAVFRKTEEKKFASARPAPQNFSFRGGDHQHIVPTGISVEKQLAQLEVLRNAGLYTKEQYREAKAKILQKA